MPARRKSLAELIADGSFRHRHHKDRLEAGELVNDPILAEVHGRYLAATDELERWRVGLEFQHAVVDRAAVRRESAGEELAQLLGELGPAGSAEQVINFAPRFLRWDDGSPFLLDDWQQDFLRLVYLRDKHGRRVFKEILLGIPRGNGKTPLATLIGLVALLAMPGRPKIFQAAGSKQQAALGVEYASNWLDESELLAFLRPRAQRVLRVDGHGYYTVVPVGGGTAHGLKPLVALLDEWWQFTTYSQTQVYTAFESALHKELEAFLLAFTTAGYDKTSQLGESYESALKLPDVRTYNDGFLTIAQDREAGRLMVWYGMPEGYELDLEDDAAVLRALQLANPGSWVNHAELLRALRRTRDVYEWLRLALNAWTQARGSWLPAGTWQALRDEQLEIPKRAPIYVAVDAAHSYDTTAVAWVWRAPDGRFVVRTKVWSVRERAPADEYVDDFYDSDDQHLAERFIVEELARDYQVVEVVGDPMFFKDPLRRLGRRFQTAPLFQGSNWMREYIQAFYRDSQAGRYAHNGDPVLTSHVAAITAEKDVRGYWKIDKLRQANPNDAAVAVIMAIGRCDAGGASGDFNVEFLDPSEPEPEEGGEDADEFVHF